jgi:hypothetical protein
VLAAKIICSDRDCTEWKEIAISDLKELNGLVCECGYGFVLERIYELSEPNGKIVSMASRRREAPSARRPVPRRHAA